MRVIRTLLSHHAPVNVAAKDKSTPLHVAAWEGRAGVVSALLARKAEVEAPERAKPRCILLLLNHELPSYALLSRHAKIDAVDERGWTSLYNASLHGHTSVAKMLLSHRANVNAAAKNGATPLHIAAEHGRVGVVLALLKRRANVDATNEDEATPLLSMDMAVWCLYCWSITQT